MVPTVVSSTVERVSSTNETRNAATPPAPCWKATSAGIWIIVTRMAMYQPMAAPTTNRGTTTAAYPMSFRTTTNAIAKARASAAVRLPLRAPFGLRNWAMPPMSTAMMISSMSRFRHVSMSASLCEFATTATAARGPCRHRRRGGRASRAAVSPFEQPRHPVGDDEAADHVERRHEHGQPAQRQLERRGGGTDHEQEQRSQDGHGRDGVGERHERRMKPLGDPGNEQVPDHIGRREDDDHEDDLHHASASLLTKRDGSRLAHRVQRA